MKVVAALVAAALGWAVPASADDFGNLRRLDEPYNVTAKRTGFDDLRLTKLNCDEAKPVSCNYAAGENVLISAFSTESADDRARFLMVIMPKDRRAAIDFMSALGVAMMTWSPFTTKEQRGKLLSQIVSGLEKKETSGGTLGGVTYSQKVMPEIGVVVMMTKPD